MVLAALILTMDVGSTQSVSSSTSDPPSSSTDEIPSSASFSSPDKEVPEAEMSTTERAEELTKAIENHNSSEESLDKQRKSAC